ncbi:hypothetical protein DPMN_190443 [Dreissena polymorpha]|uniref:Uncharacterized protein n=1 Tax=Dreissena polymorpha TaxID=45954 RepID=A0A9D4DU67_DREPO|nr:hypothetical protein DPMN_190443 [Dreissena polymorpha]
MSGLYTVRRIAVKKLANNGEIALATGLRCSYVIPPYPGAFPLGQERIHLSMSSGITVALLSGINVSRSCPTFCGT